MKNIFRKIFAPRTEYKPLIEVRVFRDAILNNLKEYKAKYPKLQFAPVLKSNAYGHGLVQVAKILDPENLPFVMVDSFFEALVLKQNQIRTKILILGYNRADVILKNKLKNVSFGIIDIEQLKIIISKLKKPTCFHLKIDTGMHRQGILVEQIDEAIELIKSNSNFILEGLCSHFADSDGEDKDFTLWQIKEWNKAKKKFSEKFLIKYFHVSNSAGTFYSAKLDVNVGRLGIGLYGINQSPFEKLNLKPALEMVSIISSVKKIKAGEKVGYGITYTAKNNMVVATVPVGYNEGVDRRLSNVGVFKINNIECSIVGRVSMNMSSIDISDFSTQYTVHSKQSLLEQEVQVISPNPTDKNSVENVAKVCGCITYEILVKIPSHLKRIVI
jgi:alanine racemase